MEDNISMHGSRRDNLRYQESSQLLNRKKIKTFLFYSGGFCEKFCWQDAFITEIIRFIKMFRLNAMR